MTTFPGEQHGLGLLMVEALLVPEGAQCISLGAQTPIEDIRRAALAHEADVVALSFSAAFPVRQAGDGLATLRRQLPQRIALWAGGEMTRRIRKTLPGVMLIPDIAGTAGALADVARAGARGAAVRYARRGALTGRAGSPAAGSPAAARVNAVSARDNAKKCRASATFCCISRFFSRICHEIGSGEPMFDALSAWFRLPQSAAQVHHSPLPRNEQRYEMGRHAQSAWIIRVFAACWRRRR